MDFALQLIANGVVIGSTYAVVSIGFALAFTVLRVVNFAHPDIFMVAMFAALFAAPPGPWAFVVAFLAGMAAAALLGYVLERTTLSPLRRRDVLMSLIATLGVSMAMQNGMALLVGPDPVPFPTLVPSMFFEIGPVLLTSKQALNFVVCLLLLAGVSAYVRLTAYGRATRAIAERPDVASAFGVNVERVCQITIVLASAMGGVAAVSIGTMYSSASAFVGAGFGLKAFICMLVAGNRYFEGVMIVGIGLGVLEALVTGYLSSNYRDAAAFLVLIAVLYIRPNGLFGSYAAH